MKEAPVCCVLVGGGGHASVVLDCLRGSDGGRVAGILVPEPERWGREFGGTRVLGGDELLPSLRQEGVTHFVIAVGSVGDNRGRQRLFDRAVEAGLEPLTVRHASSIVSSEAVIGPGCQLLPGSIVNAGANLLWNVIVNSGAIVEHDCQVGAHVHVATGARLAGAVRVEDLAHVGAGATVVQGCRVGKGAIVGAGAVVIEDVEPWKVVVGVPARPLRGAGAEAGQGAEGRRERPRDP